MLYIKIPENVKISWGKDFVKVEGPLGSVYKKKNDFSLAIKESNLYLLDLKNPTKFFPTQFSYSSAPSTQWRWGC